MYQHWATNSMDRATDSVFRLISLICVSFLLQWVASTFFYGSAELAAKLCLQFNHNFNVIQILTHPLFHSSSSLLWGLLNTFFISLVLYFFGSELERTWSSYNFLKFFLFGILGAMILGFLVSLIPGQDFIYQGIGGGNAAVLIAYAMFWPDRQILFMFFIPMKMKWFIAILFLLLAFPGGSAKLVQYSGGALAGAFFLYYYARRGRSWSAYSGSGFSGSPGLGLKTRWDEYTRKRRLQKKQEEIENRIQMKAQVDSLLDKISKEGIEALSRKEKIFLDRASKEL